MRELMVSPEMVDVEILDVCLCSRLEKCERVFENCAGTQRQCFILWEFLCPTLVVLVFDILCRCADSMYLLLNSEVF